MTLQELAPSIGMDHAGALAKLSGKEAFLLRLVKKFPRDVSYDGLCAAMTAGDLAEIRLHSHSLKGLAASLGFTWLYDSAKAMNDESKKDAPVGLDTLFEPVKRDYQTVLEGLSKLD